MTYNKFLDELGKAGLTVREFAGLLKMRPNSVSNNAKRGEVPAHLAIIAALLAEMRVRGVSYDSVFARLNVRGKRVRGAAAAGRFGGSKQLDLDLGS